MLRKRDGLLPVREALADLPGPAPGLRNDSPQARHHFTQADQVNQLVSASEADPDLGFQARMMALCSLPRSNPGNRLQYKRGTAMPATAVDEDGDLATEESEVRSTRQPGPKTVPKP